MRKANEQAEAMKASILQEADRMTLPELVGFIKAMEPPKLAKADFVKARVKTQISPELRCAAMRADDDQCTRRKKEGSDYCGTHTKGVPHGVVGAAKMRKLDLRAEDIGGIIYWLDAAHNVYKTEDVMNKKTNPAILGTWALVNEQYELTMSK